MKTRITTVVLSLTFAFIIASSPPPTQSGTPETLSVFPDFSGFGWRPVPTPGKYFTLSFYARGQESLSIHLRWGEKYYLIRLGEWTNRHTIVQRRAANNAFEHAYPFLYSSGVNTNNMTVPLADEDYNHIAIPVDSSTWCYYQLIANRGTISLRYYDTTTSKYILLLSAFDENFDDSDETVYTDYSFTTTGGAEHRLWDITNVSAVSAISPTWETISGGAHEASSTIGGIYYSNPETLFVQSTDPAVLNGPLRHTFTGGRWAVAKNPDADQVSATNPGDWTWVSSDEGVEFAYTYNYTTKIWQPYGWEATAATTQLRNTGQWIYDSTLLKWSQRGDYEEWTYNPATQQWTGTTRTFLSSTIQTSMWTFDYDEQLWINTVNGEIWSHEDHYFMSIDGDKYFFIAPENGIAVKFGASKAAARSARVATGPAFHGRLYASTDRNFYASNSVLSPNGHYDWHYPGRTSGRGHYEPWGSGDQWRWDGAQGYKNGDTTRWFPPIIPPLVVLQHQDIISAYQAAQGQSALELFSGPIPTATWTNNSRNNEFGLEIPYAPDEAEPTAPLKTTTANTQLLQNITHNPIYTMLGSWQHKDTDAGHIWEFDKSTGIWRNTTTGYEWQYSDLNSGQWSDSFDGMTWTYDENSKQWSQIIDEQG